MQAGTTRNNHFVFGLFRAEFDEELYLQTAAYCPVCQSPEIFKLLEEEEKTGIDTSLEDLIDVVCICDYRPGDNCGSLVSFEEKWEKKCEKLRKSPGGDNICQRKADFCDSSKSFTFKSLSYGVPEHDTITSEYYYFLLTTTNPCEFYQINIEPKYGDATVRVFLATSSKEVLEVTWNQVRGSKRVIVCPTSDLKGLQGTMIIKVEYLTFFGLGIDTGPALDYTITVYPKEVPPPLDRPGKKCSTQDEKERVTCLTDDTHWEISDRGPKPVEMRYFTFTLPAGSGCRKFVIQATNPIAVSDTDQRPSVSNFSLDTVAASLEIGEINTILINQCEEREKKWFIGFQLRSDHERLVVSTRGLFETIPFAELNQYDAGWKLIGTSVLTCHNRTLFCFEQLTCQNYAPVYGDRPNPFWPRNPLTYSLPEYNQLYLVQSLPPLSSLKRKGTTFAAFANVETVLFRDGVPLPRFGIPRHQLSTCEVRFRGGQITDRDGRSYDRSIPINKDSSGSCNRKDFNSVSLAMTKELKVQESVVGEELTLHNFYLDMLGFSVEFQTCLRFGLGLAERVEGPVETEFSIGCPPQILQNRSQSSFDPCCNQTVQWTLPCTPREITLGDRSRAVDEEAVATNCTQAECTATYVSDLSKATRIIENPRGCESLSTDQISTAVTWIPYNRCRDQTIGSNSTLGIYCLEDSDCYSGRCDLIHRRCLIPLEEQEKAFMRCLVKEMSPSVLYAIRSNLKINAGIGSDEFAEELRRHASSSDCGGEFDFMVALRQHEVLLSICNDSCPNNLAVLDTTSKLPIVCRQLFRGRNVTDCVKLFLPAVSKQKKCTKQHYCNWDSSCIDSRECKRQCEETKPLEYFCGWCENGQDCVEVEDVTNKESCEKKEICILPNGKIDTTMTKKECEETFQCSDICLRGGKNKECSKEECQRNGVCHGAEVLLTPKCVFPSSPYYYPSCDSRLISNLTAIDTELGCISLVTESEKECKMRYSEGRWVRYESSTKEGCEDVSGYGCQEIVSLLTWRSDFIITNKSKEGCNQLSGRKGEWKPRFNFTPSRWLSGTVRKAKWMKREFKTRAMWLDRTLNFVRLQTIIREGIDYVISDAQRTEARCVYEGRLSALNTITCNCVQERKEKEKEEKKEEICEAESSLSGFGTICPKIPIVIRVPPALIIFGSSAVSGNCEQVSVQITSAQSFQSYRVENFASSFVEPQYESNSFSFTNNQGITIGQVLADGITIETIHGGEIDEDHVIVCIAADEGIIEVDRKFKILDYGLVRRSKIIPLEVKTEYNDEQKAYCGFKVPVNELIIPIARYDDWKSVSRFSSTSTILLATLVGLFWLVMLYGALTFAYDVFILRHHYLFVHWLIVVFIAFCFLRGIYFLLLLENAIQSRFVDYFLTELPTFIYFSAFTVIIFSWSDVAVKSDLSSKSHKNILGWVVVIFGNSFMYGIFTMFMILFGLYGTDTADPTCNGRIPPPQSQLFNDPQYIIAVAYHIWITTVAIVLVAIMMYVGSGVLRLLAQSSLLGGQTKRRQKTTISIMIISLTFLAHTIWTLILVATKFRNTILAFCLLVSIEVIPIAFLIFILSPRQTGRKRGETTTSEKQRPTSSSSSRHNSTSSNPSSH